MMMIMTMMMMTLGGRWVKGVAKVVTCPDLIAQGCLLPNRLYNTAREIIIVIIILSYHHHADDDAFNEEDCSGIPATQPAV